jgi:hypothetical protein
MAIPLGSLVTDQEPDLFKKHLKALIRFCLTLLQFRLTLLQFRLTLLQFRLSPLQFPDFLPDFQDDLSQPPREGLQSQLGIRHLGDRIRHLGHRLR